MFSAICQPRLALLCWRCRFLFPLQVVHSDCAATQFVARTVIPGVFTLGFRMLMSVLFLMEHKMLVHSEHFKQANLCGVWRCLRLARPLRTATSQNACWI